jgi:fatty acid synthase
MTWEEAKSRCPPRVYPACHNAQQMVTVSGPADDVSKFVTQLQSEDIFARQVNSSGVAFHSVYVQPAGESYKTELLKVAYIRYYIPWE